MANQVIEGDRLFFIAESLAQEFSSFPDTDLEQKPAPGLLSQREVNQLNDNIASLDIDAYIEQVIAPAEAQGRKAAPEIVRQLGRLLEEKRSGPYYQAVLELDLGKGQHRQMGFMPQDRSTELGG